MNTGAGKMFRSLRLERVERPLLADGNPIFAVRSPPGSQARRTCSPWPVESAPPETARKFRRSAASTAAARAADVRSKPRRSIATAFVATAVFLLVQEGKVLWWRYAK
jgi:hypothetical protein